MHNVRLFWYNVGNCFLESGVFRQMNTQSVLLANQHWHEINPVQFGWEICAPEHAFGPASRSHLLLHYVVSGRGSLQKNGETFPVQAGQIFVIHPNEITYYKADDRLPWHYIWVGFESGISLPRVLVQPVISLPAAGEIFSRMRESAAMEAGREAFLCGEIWALLALLLQHSASDGKPESPRQDYVNAAKTFMETEYMRGISVAALAAQLNLDRSYFSSLFKKATGKSPMQYLTRLRLEKGAQLMREYGQTPGEAAASTGYADVFSFSRMFRRYYGVSPTTYLRDTAFKGDF